MNETIQQENMEKIDLIAILTGLYRRCREVYWILLVIMCLSTVWGVVQEHRQYQERYEASASFIITAGTDSTSSTAAYYNQVTLEQLNATFPYVLTSGILNQIIADDLGRDYVPGTISASVLPETNLFQIRVTANEAELAYEILQSAIENYPLVAKYVVGDTTFKLIDESGIPEWPVNSPGYRRAAFSGMVKGMMVSMVIIAVQVLVRNTVKTQEDLNRFLNIKCLSSVPQERIKKRSRASQKLLIDQSSASYAFKEAVSVLQVRVSRIMGKQDMKTLVVTSTLASEGKTTIACNLARAVSKKGYKVLLIDSDFRHPSVASMMHLDPPEKGIEDVLRGEADPDETLCCYKNSSLYVLPAVRPQDKVTRLYKSGMFEKLIAHYKEKMDLIIVDTPPCGMMNDAALAAEAADGVLLVIRQDYANRDRILEGVELLSGSGRPIIGCVINQEESGIGSYGYGRYGYGKYGYGRYGYHSHYGYGRDSRSDGDEENTR